MNNPDSAMTRQVIERALFMGIVGFIGVILNILGDDQHPDDDRQAGNGSLAHHGGEKPHIRSFQDSEAA